jgi:hypothetical protein
MRNRALVLAALIAVACSKKEEAPPAPAASASAPAATEKAKTQEKKDDEKKTAAKEEEPSKDKEKKEAEPEKKPPAAAEPGKYARGDVLKNMPKECPGGRFYLDMQKMFASPAFAKNASLLEDKLAEAADEDEKKARFAKVLETLKAEGVDPARDARELAGCVPQTDDDDPIIAVGFDTAKDLLALLEKASEKTDKKLKREDYMLTAPNTAFAQLSPGVLTITKGKPLMAKAKAATGGAPGFAIAHGKLLYAKVDQGAKKHFEITMVEKGENIDGTWTMLLAGEEAKTAKAHPAEMKAEFQRLVTGFAAQAEKGPLKILADDLKKTKVDLQGDKVTFSLTIPMADVTEVVKQMANAKPGDLKKMFR